MLTLQDIAGYCLEEALWKMLADVSGAWMDALGACPAVYDPSQVLVDGDDFSVQATDAVPHHEEFAAPEGGNSQEAASLVWTLGALVCFASSGHGIFGGRGGAYQRRHPTVALPVLRREHSALTPLVQRCLQYHPSDRPTLQQLHELALAGLQACRATHHSSLHTSHSTLHTPHSTLHDNPISLRWPESFLSPETIQ